MVSANLSDAQKSRRRVTTADGLETSFSGYFGVSAADSAAHPELGTPFPVAYRIEQDPHTQSHPHFHQTNQFQVFISGAGTFGKDAVQPVMAQYAQAFTPYGPIVAGDDGLSYLTLRNGWDPGGQFMPAQRERLRAAGRRPRALLSSLMHPGATPDPTQLREATTEVTLPLGDDGLGGWRYRVPAAGRITGPAPAGGGGQYWIVLGGSDVTGAVALTTFGCLFLGPDEPARTALAGPDGLDVLVLQFPAP